MNKNTHIQSIINTGVIAILRASSPSKLIHAAQAVFDGGVVALEVTMTTPGALEVIRQAREKLPDDLLFGAGSILDPESARAAILAGAQFIVSPSLNLRVVELCNRYSIPVFPGVFTATEIVTAMEAGVSMVKLFPASVGGPEMVKALKAPLPQVEIIPVGGVEVNNTASYIRAGAAAVGVGGSMINDRLLENNAFDEITSRAHQFILQVQVGRGKL